MTVRHATAHPAHTAFPLAPRSGHCRGFVGPPGPDTHRPLRATLEKLPFVSGSGWRSGPNILPSPIFIPFGCTDSVSLRCLYSPSPSQGPTSTPQPFSAGWVGQSVVSSIGASTPPRRVLPLRWRGWRHAGYRAWRVPIGDTVARSVGPLLRCRVMCESNMAPSCAISNSAHILSVRATHHRHDPSDPPH